MTTFSVITLGCKVNQCDTDTLVKTLQKNGYIYTQNRLSSNHQPPDIYIINTCTVTKVVDKKSLQTLRRLRRLNPGAFIAVCGCMAKRDNATSLQGKDTPVFDGADFVFDTRQPECLLAVLEKRFGKVEKNTIVETVSGSKTRAFIKVQDGCDRFCAYCIVPYVRGKPVSYPVADILQKIKDLVQSGTKEIVLTGIQLSSYGKNITDNITKTSLPKLIREITTFAPDLQRLRLSSLDPRAIDDEFLETVTQTPILCDHFHLSLQSGCDDTLIRMNRKYTTGDYDKIVERLRQIRPSAAITTDIIVGFPGESEHDFEKSLAFVESMGFARVHVFPYSLREGTKAATLPDPVPPGIKKARNIKMLALAAVLKERFLSAQIGKQAEVLMETPTQGHTRNYCMVCTVSPAKPNTLVHVHITGHNNDGLIGEDLK
jgi:threonylcarbamoyladenosine tRNA methylthiotransferase MtaB